LTTTQFDHSGAPAGGAAASTYTFEADNTEPAAALLDEAALVARAREGDATAWGALYDRHFPALYRYAYARLRTREDAEDVAAQAFLEALKGIGRYEERGRPFLAWLYRITHNLVIERLRRDERGRRFEGLLAPGATTPGPEGSLDNLDLLDALRHLTGEQQEVIILRFILQMSGKEVASILGKSQPAVYSLQVRGLAALKRLLDPLPAT
jgi:RNA polymerase sigma-70 factor (ECF subfamily)